MRGPKKTDGGRRKTLEQGWRRIEELSNRNNTMIKEVEGYNERRLPNETARTDRTEIFAQIRTNIPKAKNRIFLTK